MKRPGDRDQFLRRLGFLNRPGNRDQFLRGLKFRMPRGRKPGDGSMPALVESPRGPAPKSGGAAVALEFDD